MKLTTYASRDNGCIYIINGYLSRNHYLNAPWSHQTMEMPQEHHGSARKFNARPMEVSWISHESTTETPWPQKRHGISMCVPCMHHKHAMEAPRKHHGSFMQVRWKSHGSPMGLPRKHHGSPRKSHSFQLSPMETPWNHRGSTMGSRVLWRHHGSPWMSRSFPESPSKAPRKPDEGS